MGSVDTAPVIFGVGLTSTPVVVMQPAEDVYVIVAVPALTPFKTPVEIPTLATEKSLVLHVPPARASNKVDVDPAQTVVAPVIADGSG